MGGGIGREAVLGGRRYWEGWNWEGGVIGRGGIGREDCISNYVVSLHAPEYSCVPIRESKN